MDVDLKWRLCHCVTELFLICANLTMQVQLLVEIILICCILDLCVLCAINTYWWDLNNGQTTLNSESWNPVFLAIFIRRYPKSGCHNNSCCCLKRMSHPFIISFCLFSSQSHGPGSPQKNSNLPHFCFGGTRKSTFWNHIFLLTPLVVHTHTHTL